MLRSILLKMHFFLSAVPHFYEEIRSGCFSSRDEAYGGALCIESTEQKRKRRRWKCKEPGNQVVCHSCDSYLREMTGAIWLLGLRAVWLLRPGAFFEV